MDVGLNNTNTFTHPELKDCVFLVEANDNEYSSLWKEWSIEGFSVDKTHAPIPRGLNTYTIFDELKNVLSDENSRQLQLLEKLVESVEKHNEEVHKLRSRKVDWKEIYRGFLIPIGPKDDETYVSFRFAIINGKKIGFYSPTSQNVNHAAVEKYLITNFQLTHDGYTCWNHTDATNFHICVNSLDSLDKEPRNTVYQSQLS